MDIAGLKHQFEDAGYLHLPEYFAAELMDAYNNLIESHFREQPGYVHDDEFLSRASTEVIPWFPQQEGVEVFDEVEHDTSFSELSTAILGDGWRSLYCMVMYSHAGSSGQAWHQDCPPDDPCRFNMNRLVYSHEIEPDAGGEVVVVPGSHRLGELPVGDPHGALAGEVLIAPEQGDLLFLHGHTYHRVMPLKKAHRYSINYRAAPAGAPEDITDVCVYRNMRYRFSTSSVVEERRLSV